MLRGKKLCRGRGWERARKGLEGEISERMAIQP